MIERQQKVLGALLYPVVLTVVCIAIALILLLFVVPKVAVVFDSYRAELPLITRVLIGTSNIFRDWGIWLLLALPLPLWFLARQLDSLVKRAAQSQEPELDGRLAALPGLLGPLLIVGIGMFVVGIVFAMLLPIFQMNNLIH
jgi:type II secretory pathway component PulF